MSLYTRLAMGLDATASPRLRVPLRRLLRYYRPMTSPETLAAVTERSAYYKRARLDRDIAILAALDDGHRQADVARAANLTPGMIRHITRAAGK